MSLVKKSTATTTKQGCCLDSSVPLYELAVVSFVSESQLKENWFHKFEQFVSKCKVSGEICNFKKNSKGAPFLHVNLGVLINKDEYTNQSGKRKFWKDKDLYQSTFRQLTGNTREGMRFQPKSYRVVDNQLCMLGEVTPNIVTELKQSLRRHRFTLSKSKRCYLPLIALAENDHHHIKNKLKSLPLPSSFCLDNLSMMIKSDQIKSNNSVIIEWTDLKPHDHHRDHVYGPDDD